MERRAIGEHLEELRARLWWSVVALAASMTVALVFHRTLLEIVTLPHYRARFFFDVPPSPWQFIAKSHVGYILSMTKLAFAVGLFAASPVIGWQAWRFVATGLYAHERRAAGSFAVTSFLLFVLGVATGYFHLVPVTLYGMARMLPLDQVAAVFDISEYMDLVLTMTVVLGALFQLPLAMAFLSRIGLVPARAWGRARRHAVVANVAVAAFLSPPDPLSMAVYAVPLVGLYEAGILSARWVRPDA